MHVKCVLLTLFILFYAYITSFQRFFQICILSKVTYALLSE